MSSTAINGYSPKARIRISHLIQSSRKWLSWLNSDEQWNVGPLLDSRNEGGKWVRKTTAEPESKKCKRVLSAGKVMATLFWDWKGIILQEYLSDANDLDTDWKYIVTASHYFDPLMKLHAAIKTKIPGLSTKGVILIQDNVSPHTFDLSQWLLKDLKWEIVHPFPQP